MTIFEEIRADHDKQRTLVGLLVKTHGDSEGREELFHRLETALKDHEAAEERHFYVPLMEHDATQKEARHGVAEHHEIDELLNELEKTDYSSSGWLATAKKLKEKLLHHLEEEEHEFFQLAGKSLSESEKVTLGQKYRVAMNSGLGKVIE